MKVELAPGKYVVAVSGGVDSVVLLDLLVKKSDLELVVAHFDHGIRQDSAEDRKFVQKLAKEYGLPFIFTEGKLGPSASEALARDKRYEFLNKAREERGAVAIITAHHQDDLLETAIINLLRGTNRRGLSSLATTSMVKRPLLNYPKQQIKDYALANQLTWHEDPTNADTKYLRNYVRQELVPKLGASGQAKLLDLIASAKTNNTEIDRLIADLLKSQANELDRHWFATLPDNLGREILAGWLRASGITSYDKKTLARLVVASQSAKNGTIHNIVGNRVLAVSRDYLALKSLER